jgi:hypothetical protein
MSKVVLQLEAEVDFNLICISSHHKEYRLCWDINHHSDMEFKRVEEYFLGDEKSPAMEFAQFVFEDELEHRTFYLLSNSCLPRQAELDETDLFPTENQGKLVPELRRVDYLLQVYGHINEQQLSTLVSEIGRLNMVQACWQQDAEKLKSKTNLLR